MKRHLSICVFAGVASLLSVAAFGQGKGGGAGVGGGVVGGVTGTVNGAANGTVSRPTDTSKGGGNGAGGLGSSVNGTLNATQNTALSTHLAPLLPSNMTVPAAAAGFANQGEFVSAVHVAHNLNIPFDQLKAQMTGANATSLGKAIQKLDPKLDSKTIKDNLKLADRQADRDLQQAAAGGKPDKVSKSITSDSNLSSRLTAMLPPGTTLADAATGFKNQGQFIAALEASKNLSIPFADLKDRMTAGQSLGDAIHALKPSMSEGQAQAGAKAAEDQSVSVQADSSAQARSSVK